MSELEMKYSYTLDQIQDIMNGERPNDPEYPLMSLETMIWFWGKHGKSANDIHNILQKFLKFEQERRS